MGAFDGYVRGWGQPTHRWTCPTCKKKYVGWGDCDYDCSHCEREARLKAIRVT